MRPYSAHVSAQAKVIGLGLSAALSTVLVGGLPAVAQAESADDVVSALETPVVEGAVREETPQAAEPATAAAAPEVIAVPDDAPRDTVLNVVEEPAPQAQEEVPEEQAQASESEVEASEDSEAAPAAISNLDPKEKVESAETSEDQDSAQASEQPLEEAARPVTAKVKAAQAVQKAQVTTVSSKGTVAQAEVTYENMYRLYNPNSGEHFYTKDLAEAKTVVRAGWRWEGVGWVAPSTSSTPVFRLYSGTDHHFTTSSSERDWLIRVGWKSEGIGWYSELATNGKPLYRQFNPNVDPSASKNNSGSHNYTLSKAENDHLVKVGWKAEGIGWYGANMATKAIQGFWIETGAWGNGTQLYWIGSDAQVAKGRVVDPTTARDRGAGFEAYATDGTGAVVRGKTLTSNGMMFASKKGEWIDLKTLGARANDWLVTDRIDGVLQRYYVIKLNNGQLGAKVGQFTASINGKSSTFYGRTDQGYVLRNATTRLGDWKWYQADNDGRLTFISSGKIGWQNPSGYYQVSAYDVSLPSYASGFFAYTTDSRIRPEATRSQVVEAFIQRAYDYLGTPYKWDYALAPGVGVDCSGLVMQCMEAVGIKSVYNSYDHMYDPWQDHDAANMLQDSKIPHVAYADRRRGDLIFYSGHVAIYLGNNQVIHSSNYAVPFDGVQISSVTHRGVIAVGRLFA